MIRVATVGCGYFSRFHHDAWKSLAVRHVGVCDHDRARADAFQARYEVESAYDDLATMLAQCQPDLVDIILPPDQHLEAIRIAHDAGCHIICQKPFCQNIDEARLAVSLADAGDRHLVVHENFRFQPWYRTLKQRLDSGVDGALYQIHFRLRPGDGQGAQAYLDRQPYFQTMPAFLIRETGIHFIDVFRFLAGDPVSVFADLRQLNPAIRGEDAGFFILEHADGVRSMFDGNRLVDHVAIDRRLTMGEMMVESANGTCRLDGDGRLWHRRHDHNDESRIDYGVTPDDFGGGCVRGLQQHVLDAIATGIEPENSAARYLRNLEIQAAIYRSSQEGKKLVV